MSLTLYHSEMLDGVPHGFCGRRGGVSTGAVASLNCGLGSGDDPELVMENRRRASEAIAPDAALVGVFQVHSPTCITVTEPWSHAARPEADAMVTDRPGILLSIVTADCAPILFIDDEAAIIGAAHAGWRGALSGVTDTTIAAMEALGSDRSSIVAVIGPCIAQDSYEVDLAFRDRFLAASADNEAFFRVHGVGQPKFDLAGYIAHRLALAEICAVHDMEVDTYAEEDDFYSFRRATHRGEPDYGRQLSAIALPED